MNIGPLSMGAVTSAGVAPASERDLSNNKKIAGSARQFEALMIGQILKSAHGSESSGWLGADEDDESASTAIQVAEEYLGQAIADSGGLGIAKMVIQGMNKSVPKPANSGPLPASPEPYRTD